MEDVEIRSHYFAQQQVKQQLNAQLTLPVAVLSVLVGLLAALLSRVAPLSSSAQFALAIFCGLGMICCLPAFYFLVRALARARYREVGDIENWIAHRESLKLYAIYNPGLLCDPEQEYRNDLNREYASVTDVVQDENIRRSVFLYWSRTWLAAAAAFLALATIPYLIQGPVTKEDYCEQTSASAAADPASVKGHKGWANASAAADASVTEGNEERKAAEGSVDSTAHTRQ